jgi:uncharacterized membrane protein
MKSLVCILGATFTVVACTPPIPVTVTELAGWGSAARDVSDSGRIVGYVGALALSAAEFGAAGAVLEMPGPVGYSCEAVAVTNDGRIAGTCRARANVFYPNRSSAFFAASIEAPPELITPPDGVLSSALDMNEHGVILGVKNTPGAEDFTPWIYDTATKQLTELPSLPNKNMSAVAINDLGDIVGTARVPSSDGSGYVHEGVKWSGDSLTITTLPIVPADINNRGDIVGGRVYWPAGAATPQTLPEPVLGPGKQLRGAAATDLNDEGFIVGFASLAGSDEPIVSGVAWTPEGTPIDLGMNIMPHAVNSSRVIVGARDGKAVRVDLPADLP